MVSDKEEIQNAIKVMQYFRLNMDCKYCPLDSYCSDDENDSDSICCLFNDKIDELEEEL